MNKKTLIELTGSSDGAIYFYSLLQRGFFLETETGISLHEFLSGVCSIGEEYIKNRIKTVFLDGHPVDDFKKAVIRDGNVLSLSGPMPGLVGATMRAGGFYSSFRSGITYREEGKGEESGRGLIYLKLFNIVMSDLGRDFLGRGIICTGDLLKEFFSGQKEEFWGEISLIEVDGKKAEAGKLREGGLFTGSLPVELKLNRGE